MKRLLLLATLLLAACGSTTRPLPTLSSDNGFCRGVGLLNATLAGDPNDPQVAWLAVSSGRKQTIWPPGFSARFDPNLQVLDAAGRVVFHAGDKIGAACVAGPPKDPGSVLLTRPGY